MHIVKPTNGGPKSSCKGDGRYAFGMPNILVDDDVMFRNKKTHRSSDNITTSQIRLGKIWDFGIFGILFVSQVGVQL